MSQYIEKTDTDNDEITIDLREIFSALWKKAHLILLCGIVTALLAFIGTKVLITPMYTSETKVYVISKTGENGMNSGDFQVGTYLTKDYMELIKSRTVMEQVIAALDLDIQPNELKNQITVSSAADTRILSISVSNANPKLAREIADALREVVSIQITEIMGADAVNTVDPAYLPKAPSSPNTMKNTMLGGLLGCILAMAVVIVIYILDDTIKTPEDVERYLGLNVLTSIPIEEGERQSAGERRKKKAQTRKKSKKTKRK